MGNRISIHEGTSKFYHNLNARTQIENPIDGKLKRQQETSLLEACRWNFPLANDTSVRPKHLPRLSSDYYLETSSYLQTISNLGRYSSTS